MIGVQEETDTVYTYMYVLLVYLEDKVRNREFVFRGVIRVQSAEKYTVEQVRCEKK